MRPCPRCDQPEIEVIGKSPVEECWELYLCQTCGYVWRSSETDELLAGTVKLGPGGVQSILDSHRFVMKRLEPQQ